MVLKNSTKYGKGLVLLKGKRHVSSKEGMSKNRTYVL